MEFHVHIPPHDTHLARQSFGTHWTHKSLQAADIPPETEILSVLIHDDVTPAVLEQLPNLRAIITRSDGFDHLPLEWMHANDIAGYHLEGYATNSVARMTIMYILMLLRRIPEASAETRNGGWNRNELVGRDLEDVQIGIVGLGRIGAAVATQLLALGANVMGFDADSTVGCNLAGLERVSSLESVLAADVVTLHIPLTDHTTHLIDASAMAQMPPGALLVNTARGSLVDVDALLAALDSGHLAGYAADVVPSEPHAPDVPRMQRNNIILSPHLGAHTKHTLQRRYALTRTIVDTLDPAFKIQWP